MPALKICHSVHKHIAWEYKNVQQNKTNIKIQDNFLNKYHVQCTLYTDNKTNDNYIMLRKIIKNYEMLI